MKIRALHLLPLLALAASPLYAQAPAPPAAPPAPPAGPPATPPPAPAAEHARRPHGDQPATAPANDARELVKRLRQLAQEHPEVARRILREVHGGQPQAATPAEAPRRMARENVAQLAKARHLREAATHLAAAGYPDQAAKAREEAERLAAQIKPLGMAPQRDRTPASGMAPGVAGRPNPWHQNMPQANRQGTASPDAQPLLQELRKLNQQLGELSRRVERLEHAAPR